MKYMLITFLILSAALLVTLDVFFSFLSDRKVRNESCFTDQRIENATLGPGYNDRTGCQIGAVFYFYTYKTCFIRRTQRGFENWSHRFLYAGPLPTSLSFMNNFRFEMI